MPSPLGQEFTLYIDDIPWHCLVTSVEVVDMHAERFQDMRLTIRMWPDPSSPRRSHGDGPVQNPVDKPQKSLTQKILGLEEPKP